MLLRVVQRVYFAIAGPSSASVLRVKFDLHLVPVFAFEPEANSALLLTDRVVPKFRKDARLLDVRFEFADVRPDNVRPDNVRPDNARPVVYTTAEEFLRIGADDG